MSRRRTIRELRKKILTNFDDSDLSILQLSKKTGIDWYTVERQLIYLKGLDLVSEVFRHRSLRLFHITELGRDVANELSKNKKKNPNQDEKRIVRMIKRKF